MDYTTFKHEYKENIRLLMTYSPNEVGAQHYSEILGRMYDERPMWANQAEKEWEDELLA